MKWKAKYGTTTYWKWGSSACCGQWLTLKYVNTSSCSVDQGGQPWQVRFRWAIADRPTRTGLVMIHVHYKFVCKKFNCLEDVGWTNTEDLKVPSLCCWCWTELGPNCLNCLPNNTLACDGEQLHQLWLHRVQKIWMSHLLRILNLYCELDPEESNQTFCILPLFIIMYHYTMFGCK